MPNRIAHFYCFVTACFFCLLAGCSLIAPKSPTERLHEDWQAFVYNSSLLSGQALLQEINTLDSTLSGYQDINTSHPSINSILGPHEANRPIENDAATIELTDNTAPGEKDKTRLQLAYLLMLAEKKQARAIQTDPETNLRYLHLSKSLLGEITEVSEYKNLADALLIDIDEAHKQLVVSNLLLSFQQLDALDSNQLNQRRQSLEEQLGCCASKYSDEYSTEDETLIQLAYLLSIPKVTVSQDQLKDIVEKLAVPAAFSGEDKRKRAYAIFSRMIINKLDLKQQLNLQKMHINALQHQLDTLKNIDQLMDENQRNLDSVIPKQ